MSDKKEPARLCLWRVTHVHRHGEEHYLVYAYENLAVDSIRKWAEADLVENFEPHRDDEVLVERVNEVYTALAARDSAPTPVEELSGPHE